MVSRKAFFGDKAEALGQSDYKASTISSYLLFCSRFISCVDIHNEVNINNEKTEEEYPVSIISISNMFENSMMELREVAKIEKNQRVDLEQLQKMEEDNRLEEVGQKEDEERRINAELETGQSGEVREQHPEQR